MEKLRFLKKHKYDILAPVLVFITTRAASDYVKPKLYSWTLAVVATIIVIILEIYFRGRDKDFHFISLDNRDDEEDWEGQGEFKFTKTNRCFSITNSDLGYIFPKCRTWSDYKFEFEFKIINTCVGAIVRARDLSNYVMLQITTDGIRPHVRVNDGWKVWEHAEANLSFKEKLSLDEWYKCSLSCEKDTIYICLYEKQKVVFERSWQIPQDKYVDFPIKTEDGQLSYIPLRIDLRTGTVGFRNAHVEKALIKNVQIKQV